MIRLLIADDHPIVREGLKRIIADLSDMQLIGEAKDGNEVLKMCGENNIDVLLLDISMPGPGFLELLHRIQQNIPNLRVLILSMHQEDHYVIRSLKAGAKGYLTKNNTSEELSYAIRHVYNGRTYVTPELAEKLVDKMASDVEIHRHELLSEREFQILCMIGSGKETNNIATILSLSPKTVSTYRSRILAKMQLKSKAELIRYAIEQGLIE